MKKQSVFSKLAVALVLLALSRSAFAVKVGDPAHPELLQAQLDAAFKKKARKVTILPGKYLLPGGKERASLWFNHVKNTEIEAQGVEFSMLDGKDALGFNNCTNLSFGGATVHYDHPRFSQAKILGFGTDAVKGAYYEVQIDAGYPIDAAFKSAYIFDPVQRKIKFHTGDFSAKSVEMLDQSGHVRVYWPSAQMLPPHTNVAAGDYLVCRGDGNSLLHTDACRNCTFEELNFYWGGVFGIFETGPSVRNHYHGIKISTGPAPEGGTQAPLLSQSADGLHSAGARIGPDISNCTFENMADDAIAIHGYYADVIAGKGAVLSVKENPGFKVGDLARVSNAQGFFDESKVKTVVRVADGTVLTLERPIAAKPGFKVGDASASGGGYRIINNTIRNNRARGILAKGDDGLIEGNTIDGCTMSGISIGPEASWNEAGYCRDVIIRSNLIENTNYATNNFGRNGGVWVHGDGAQGNRGIMIGNNHFVGVLGPNLLIEWANGVQVLGNSFQNTHAQSVGTDDMAHSLVWLENSREVNFSGNSVYNAGVDLKPLVSMGKNVSGVHGEADGVVLKKSE